MHPLEQRYPGLPWREPIKITHWETYETWIGCRICVGQFGLKMREIGTTPYVFRDTSGHAAHMAQAHHRQPPPPYPWLCCPRCDAVFSDHGIHTCQE